MNQERATLLPPAFTKPLDSFELLLKANEPLRTRVEAGRQREERKRELREKAVTQWG